MDLVLHALYLIAVHKFLFLVPAVGGLVLLPRSRKRIALRVGLMILAILNMPFGMSVAGRMIHRFGEKGVLPRSPGPSAPRPSTTTTMSSVITC